MRTGTHQLPMVFFRVMAERVPREEARWEVVATRREFCEREVRICILR